MSNRDDYYGDVIYEVWRSGGNPDLVDYDRCDDYMADRLDEYIAAHKEMKLQRGVRGE